MKMDKIRKKLDDNPVYASTACREKNLHFYKQALDTLQKANISMDENIHIEFGLRKSTSFMYIGHRSVILKCLDGEKTAFKLELEIEDVPYIKGNYNCPIDACSVKDKSFTELANHHFFAHRNKNEDDFSHICCKQNFEHFEQFCEHVFITHRYKQNTVCLNFEQITVEKFDKFLSPEQTQFYPSFDQKITFKTALDVACEIIMGFDRYWIFMWNCQDFASWYLYTMGIPLTLVDPTVPDKLTGSGSQCSAQKVQRLKGWAWYKEPKQLEKFTSLSIKANVVCTRCEYLPPLTIEAMVNHQNTAHMDDDTATPWEKDDSLSQPSEREMLHHLCGFQFGMQLEDEPTRKWKVYRLQCQSKVDAHASLIFQPWLLGDHKERTSVTLSNLYVTVEKRLDCAHKPYLYVGALQAEHVKKLHQICEIAVSIQELVDYISLMYAYLILYGLSTNCIAFVKYLAKILYEEKMAARGVFLVDSLYTRHRINMRKMMYRRIEKMFMNDSLVDDVHNTVSSSELRLKGRISSVCTSFYGKYNGMTPLPTVFIMVLLQFKTISSLIFPLVALFILYLTDTVVLSRYREPGQRMWSLRMVKLLNTNSKFVFRDGIFVSTMVYMVYEVSLEYGKCLSMALVLLVWLNHLYMYGVIATKVKSEQNRYEGIRKPGYLKLLYVNMNDTLSRFVLVTNFLLPVGFIPYAILGFLILLVSVARKYPMKSHLFNFTGNTNLEFLLCFFVFMFILTGTLFFLDVVAVNSISYFHLLSILAYFIIFCMEERNLVFKKSKYVSDTALNFGNGLEKELQLRTWNLRLRLTGMLNNLLFWFLIIVFPVLSLACGFRFCLFLLNILLYLYSVTVRTMMDCQQIVMSYIESGLKVKHPSLSSVNLLR